MSSTVVATCDCSESFLPGCVPLLNMQQPSGVASIRPKQTLKSPVWALHLPEIEDEKLRWKIEEYKQRCIFVQNILRSLLDRSLAQKQGRVYFHIDVNDLMHIHIMFCYVPTAMSLCVLTKPWIGCLKQGNCMVKVDRSPVFQCQASLVVWYPNIVNK
jgi:hypothetical protein